MELFEHVNSNITTINTDVVQEGMASVSHMIKANPKIAITLCSMTLISGNPIRLDGMFHNTKNTVMAIRIFTILP